MICWWLVNWRYKQGAIFLVSLWCIKLLGGNSKRKKYVVKDHWGLGKQITIKIVRQNFQFGYSNSFLFATWICVWILLFVCLTSPCAYIYMKIKNANQLFHKKSLSNKGKYESNKVFSRFTQWSFHYINSSIRRPS